ncbi:tRNA pseudouridine synthase B [Clostridium sp. CAG:780]|nr:tRNA pseudouridine synthase B [Clostridium sp. CAG:780]
MDGIIIINKEKNYTSNDVVSIVKKITKSKVGHTGTLDPNATGVLPLLIGNATKISKYLINHDKEYEVVLQLGIRTETADVEGKVIEEKEVTAEMLNKDNIEEKLQQFIGKQEQIPPIYSAIKVNGKKLYEYARRGQEVELKPRQIEIYSIQLVGINEKEKQISFKVKCSKGTYIRSLCEDISKKLGTVGYMKELNRLQVGEFYIKDAVTISEMKEKIEAGNLENIITIEEIFKNNPQIQLEQEQIEPYINGVKINTEKTNGVYRIYKPNGTFIGLGIIENSKLKRDLVI